MMFIFAIGIFVERFQNLLRLCVSSVILFVFTTSCHKNLIEDPMLNAEHFLVGRGQLFTLHKRLPCGAGNLAWLNLI